MKHDKDRPDRQDPAARTPEPPDSPPAASGGTRSRAGSNYGDWRPDDDAQQTGVDGSKRSGDWPKVEKAEPSGTPDTGRPQR